MLILRKLREAVGAVPRARMLRDLRRFLAATADCRGQQQQVLQRLIALNGESRFGREHRLTEVRSTADLRQRVPVTDYEDYRDAVESMKQGDPTALLGPKNRLLMFSLSSGTTGQSKFIPVTDAFVADYRRGWQIWGIQSWLHHKRMAALNIVQLTSDHEKFMTPAGVPCGNISGLVAAMQNAVVRTMYTVPAAVAKIREPEVKQYVTLRIALADPHIGSVSTANPSTLIHLARLADRNAERLIRDIADGTVSPPGELPEEIRRRLGRRISGRARGRARQLARIVETTGHLYPRDYWREMQMISVWTGGSCGAYLHTLRQLYGDVPLRDHGLSASEGRMTIPLIDETPDGVLDVTSHFFEFIPVEDAESREPTVLEAHELQEGREYFILLTTASGLFRYNISDVVRCNGFHGTTPRLEFLHKGAYIANVTGEKVSESQVVEAVRDSLRQQHVELRHFTVSPVWGDPPQYQLLAETTDLGSSSEGQALAARADARLQELNCEYREKRETGRLGPLQWHPLPPETWQRFAERRQKSLGGSLEQYKHPCLVPDMNFCARLMHEFASAPRPEAATAPPGGSRRHGMTYPAA